MSVNKKPAWAGLTTRSSISDFDSRFYAILVKWFVLLARCFDWCTLVGYRMTG